MGGIFFQITIGVVEIRNQCVVVRNEHIVQIEFTAKFIFTRGTIVAAVTAPWGKKPKIKKRNQSETYNWAECIVDFDSETILVGKVYSHTDSSPAIEFINRGCYFRWRRKF